MVLAGISVRNTLVLELAIMLRREDFDRTADLLEGCVAAGLPTVILTDADREAISCVLVDGPPGLEQLRAGLAQETDACRAHSA